ncbi:hypothetical protein BD560DRAFT_410687 [Blakeslea trispora]|nr:hypothetical protein BD560DRAFT_410687 [Blakeslea trispora]
MVSTELSRLVQHTNHYQSTSNNHNKQKEKKEPPLNKPDCCLICNQQLTKTYPLSSPAKNKVWCTGCARLLGPYKNDMAIRQKLIKELSIPRKSNGKRTRARKKRRKRKVQQEAQKIPSEPTPVPSMTSTIHIPEIEQPTLIQDVYNDMDDQVSASCFSSCFPFSLLCWIKDRFRHKKQSIPMQETPYQYKKIEQPRLNLVKFQQPKPIKQPVVQHNLIQPIKQPVVQHNLIQHKLIQPNSNKQLHKSQPLVTNKKSVKKAIQKAGLHQTIQQNETPKKKAKRKTKKKAEHQQELQQVTREQPKPSSPPHLLKKKPLKIDKESSHAAERAGLNYNELASRSRRTMSNRLKKFRRYGCQEVDIPTSEELVELMIQSKNICAISGIKGHWNSANYHSPFRLDFDHKIPVSMGGSFRAENLQITINCLNSVKGSETQDELKRWLKGFRANKLDISSH